MQLRGFLYLRIECAKPLMVQPLESSSLAAADQKLESLTSFFRSASSKGFSGIRLPQMGLGTCSGGVLPAPVQWASAC